MFAHIKHIRYKEVKFRNKYIREYFMGRGEGSLPPLRKNFWTPLTPFSFANDTKALHQRQMGAPKLDWFFM